MVVEYIRHHVSTDRQAEFENAYATASSALETSPHCLAYEVSRCVEHPEHYVVRIEWDSVEGHERGFRSSPDLPGFFAAVKPFFQQIHEMRHYQPTDVASAS